MRSWFTDSTSQQGENIFCRPGAQLQTAFLEQEDVAEFIRSLYLLEHVPADALLADGQLLPPEALRLFYLDDNWIACMVDGALSIGRSCTADRLHDRAVVPRLRQSGRGNSQKTRSRLYRKPIREAAEEGQHRMGFLLRSQLVEGWPGLEVCCSCGGRELDLIKLQHMGTSILFCIAEGVFDTITLTEPAESIYFGFEEEQGELVKELVSLKEGKAGQNIGRQLPPVFRDQETGLLNVGELAKNMNQTLTEAGEGSNYFSALEFALQMLQERARCTITIHGEEACGRGGEANE